MALQLVGGAFLSSFLNVLFDKLASRQVINFLKGQKLDVRQLEKLEITLNSVNGLLDDAEDKQITKTAVKNWLNRLRDVAYEADDLLDDISYEALRSELEAGDSETSEAKLKEIPERLEKVLERLEYLAKQKDILGLRERAVEKASSQRVPTTCVVDESDVYGRDADKEAILKLLRRDNANGNELEVIPIVGMGGVGKTTLAQLVFNDNRVEEWFDLRVWVCVSEDYDALTIAKEILNQVSDSVNCNKMNLNQLYIALKESLMGKKLLLALDDVWNDRYADWDFLRTPLKFGSLGSKIIVTTRNENVASIMRTVPTYHLKKLDDENCWRLFAKHAFSGGYFDENKEVIGRKIVRKCGGLPLAAKTLGGLLRCERDIAKWKNISKSNLWELRDDTILPALRLSYRYLPSCLKQCFAFCAIFPKGYKFQKYRVIRFWMAEGFLVQPNAEKEMEEVGAEYFDDLVSRSFFQPTTSGGSAFTMHDLINDLAKHVCGEFLSRLEGDNACKIAERTRYLSYKKASCDDSKKFEGIYDAQLLRCFVPLPTRSKREIPGEVVHDLICALKCLRVLSLSGYINVVDLPNSIGNLKHLRYLSLMETGIEKLPDIVSTLYNLQTLILKKCCKLIELPRNIGRLIHLRCLNIKGTKLQWMPPQMRNLKNLRKLTDFITGKQRESSSSISELGELPHLEEGLVVRNLQYVTDSPATLKDIMKHKAHLKKLELRWNGDTYDSLHERGILEKLQPYTNIQKLSIIGYGGTRFADWVGDSSFSKITSLELKGCDHCSSLPPLGQLISLENLSISRFDSVVTVGPEFFGSCNMAMKIPFRSLTTLKFAKMPQWKEWIVHEGSHEEAFPCLQHLYITDCPNLTKCFSHHIPSLKRLEIEGCEQLVAPFPTAPNIPNMTLRDNSCRISLCPWVYKLQIECSSYTSLERKMYIKKLMAGVSTSLKEIDIRRDDSLQCFQLELFPNLKKLYIQECSNLRSLSVPETTNGIVNSLSHLEIHDCPNFSIFKLSNICWNFFLPRTSATLQLLLITEDSHELRLEKLSSGLYCLKVCHSMYSMSMPKRIQGMCGPSIALEEIQITRSYSLQSLSLELFPKLKSLVVDRCPRLKSFIASEESPGNVPSLDSLVIRDCPRLLSCLQGELHVLALSNLKTLVLWNCFNLKSLPQCMHLLSSLLNLVLHGCPELESFPGGFPNKLESLEIYDCKKLIDGRMQWDLHRLSALSRFVFGGYYQDLECFPEETLLPSTLAFFKIVDLGNLKFLNYKGLQQLTSLKRLEIQSCLQIQCLPEEGLPSSISCLIIDLCPILAKRCELWKGEDWPKISHIADIGGLNQHTSKKVEEFLAYVNHT